jgi:hypothetical protein
MRVWLRTRPRWLIVVCITATAATAIGVPVALATDLFTDVPTDSAFHDDIGAIARAGITARKACVPPSTPPTYCPNENVERQAMAAFMHGGFGRVASGTDSAAALTSATDVTLGSITLAPGIAATALAGAAGFIKIDATVTLVVNDPTGCPCVFCSSSTTTRR